MDFFDKCASVKANRVIFFFLKYGTRIKSNWAEIFEVKNIDKKLDALILNLLQLYKLERNKKCR